MCIPPSTSPTHLETGVLAGAQSPHPHLREQDLTAGVRDEVPVVGAVGESETRLLAPGAQLVGEQLLGEVIIRLVTVLQEVQRQTRELPGTQHFIGDSQIPCDHSTVVK